MRILTYVIMSINVRNNYGVWCNAIAIMLYFVAVFNVYLPDSYQ